MATPTQDRLRGMLVGLATGDALGMPLEFKSRFSRTFQPVTGMQRGGPFELPKGYWTDDTSMALCLADSIIEKKGYDSFDVMDRYIRWHTEGYRSSLNYCFDIGSQTIMGLSRFDTDRTIAKLTGTFPLIPVTEPRQSRSGNGCIMRLAPVVIASAAAGNSAEKTAELAAISGRETHYSTEAETGTAIFGAILQNALVATRRSDVLAIPRKVANLNPKLVRALSEMEQAHADDLDPAGYVKPTLEVATWAFLTSETFEEGALKAVNMAGDSDTIGAVYGQIAGAFYGMSNILQEWRQQLHQCDELTRVADELSASESFNLVASRFAEDANRSVGHESYGIA